MRYTTSIILIVVLLAGLCGCETLPPEQEDYPDAGPVTEEAVEEYELGYGEFYQDGEVWVSYADDASLPVIELSPYIADFDETALTPAQPFCPQDIRAAVAGCEMLGDFITFARANRYQLNGTYPDLHVFSIKIFAPESDFSMTLRINFAPGQTVLMPKNGQISDLPTEWLAQTVKDVAEMDVYAPGFVTFRGVGVGSSKDEVMTAFPVTDGYVPVVIYSDNYGLNPGVISNDGDNGRVRDQNKPYCDAAYYADGDPVDDNSTSPELWYYYGYEPPFEEDPHYAMYCNLHFDLDDLGRVEHIYLNYFEGFSQG